MTAPYLVFAGGRGSGKTTRIIAWLREDSRRRVWLRTAAERRLYLDAGIDPRQLLLNAQQTRGYSDVAVERDSRFFDQVSTYRTWLA